MRADIDDVFSEGWLQLPRVSSEPWGGFYTSTLLPGKTPAASFTRTSETLRPGLLPRQDWWRLHPAAGARVLELFDLTDCRAASSRFPWCAGQRLDWGAVAAAGYDAVRVHPLLPAAGEAAGPWPFEFTLWLRWCFTDWAALPVPADLRPAPPDRPPPPVAVAPPHVAVWLGEPCADAWLVCGPEDGDRAARAAAAWAELVRQFERSVSPDPQIVQALVTAWLDTHVRRTNLHGGTIPLGCGWTANLCRTVPPERRSALLRALAGGISQIESRRRRQRGALRP